MSEQKYSDFHNELHEKFSKINQHFTIKKLKSNEINEFTYSINNKYFIFQNKTNRIILELYWTDDGVVFTDPFSNGEKYQIM